MSLEPNGHYDNVSTFHTAGGYYGYISNHVVTTCTAGHSRAFSVCLEQWDRCKVTECPVLQIVLGHSASDTGCLPDTLYLILNVHLETECPRTFIFRREHWRGRTLLFMTPVPDCFIFSRFYRPCWRAEYWNLSSVNGCQARNIQHEQCNWRNYFEKWEGTQQLTWEWETMIDVLDSLCESIKQ